jgi:cytochrome P450
MKPFDSPRHVLYPDIPKPIKKTKENKKFLDKYITGPKDKFLFIKFKLNAPKFLLKSYKQYGDLFSFMLNKELYVCAFSPESVNEVAVTKEFNFIKGPGFNKLRKVLGTGLLTNEEPVHMFHKRVLSSPFHKNQINLYAKDMVLITRNHLNKIKNKKKIKINIEMMSLTFDIVTNLLFGSDLSKNTNRFQKNMSIVINRCEKFLPFKLSKLEKYKLPYFGKLKKSANELHEISKNIVDERINNNIKKNDLLDVLIESIKNKSLSKEEVYDEALTLIFAGHETTSNTIVWATSYLSDKPELWKELKNEYDEVFKYENTEEFAGKIFNAEVSEAVIKETLRLCSPVWISPRKAINDVLIDGIEIKKGTNVIMSQYVNHRNEKYFYSPEDFIPQRWYNNFEKTLPNGVYFPFNIGPRRCIGDQFGLMESKIILLEIANKMILSLDSKFPKYSAKATFRQRGNVIMNVNKQ